MIIYMIHVFKMVLKMQFCCFPLWQNHLTGTVWFIIFSSFSGGVYGVSRRQISDERAINDRITITALKIIRSCPFEPYSLSLVVLKCRDRKYRKSIVCVSLELSSRHIDVDVPPRLPAISGRARWVMCCTAPLPPPPLPSV